MVSCRPEKIPSNPFCLAVTWFILAGFASQTRGDDTNHFARWEKDIAAFAKSDHENPPPKNGIVFVGSSSIRLWDLKKSFPAMSVINRGFGGSHLADVVHFVRTLVIKHQPRLVVLYAGENDIAAGAKPAQVAGDFREFVRIVHKELPETEIIYLSIKPSVARWKIVEELRTANRLIEEECKKDRLLRFLDVATPLLGDDGKPRRELFADDGLHLNEKGYAVWASILKSLLEKKLTEGDRELVMRLLAEAKANGDARRGAEVFRSPQFACLTCHKVATQGGTIGPDLTLVSRCLPPDQIVESVLWPTKRQIKEGYMAISVVTRAGRIHTGYKERENDQELVLKDPPTGNLVRVAKAEIEERTDVGTLMPDGLAEAMSAGQRRDVIRFLLELGAAGSGAPEKLLAHSSEPATFPYNRDPLQPEYFPSWRHYVNRDRLYDFYVKEAEYFRKHPGQPLLPEFPGLDGAKYGHWGNQNEDAWADDRWNKAILGSVMCGVLHAPGMVVPKGVCVRIGVLQPGNAMLRSSLAKRLCQILRRAPRFLGRPDS